jgi:hypothetical protein
MYNSMSRHISFHRQIHRWSAKHIEEETYSMSVQGRPTRHIDITSKTNAVLSTQRKAIHLSTYILTSSCKRGSEYMEGSSLT